jgi:hypothetical protein
MTTTPTKASTAKANDAIDLLMDDHMAVNSCGIETRGGRRADSRRNCGAADLRRADLHAQAEEELSIP